MPAKNRQENSRNVKEIKREMPLNDAPPPAPGAQLPKAYDPSLIEHHWAEYWNREHLFDVPTPDSPGNSGSTPFTILLPPPNVTGRLHMGHMLNQTEMDILMRWHRMSGEVALWVPGTDHAGIATQMMVERQLAAEGTSRKALGREAFEQRVWDWKRQYGSAISDQMKRLGVSVDWSREYFTMDERLSQAVKEAFVRLWEQGLIYRGAYIVNWDPVQQTAVSDLEVTHEERSAKLYHVRYPFADGTGSIVIATTRPETMLGDVAVAVNAQDERYKDAIGKLVELPLSAAAAHADRNIPILADDWANPEFGTGAVKVTPAHDPNDFAIGQRHNLPSLLIMDETAHIDLPGSPYHGLDRFAAREKIVADLEAAGLLVGVHDHTHAIALSQRSGAVIEPRLSLQWFLAVNKKPEPSTQSAVILSGARSSERAESKDPAADRAAKADRTVLTEEHQRNSIAQNAIDAVRDGHIKFTPEMYTKTYMEWMNNIHDWCISRQLWWGHRIPAWHCPACHGITVSREVPAACSACGDTHIEQSTDVLDTWFSSGLLPFTVFDWPNPTPDTGAPLLTPALAAFYPTSLLVTGFDILFFWVARMIMLGCHFMLDVPTRNDAGEIRLRTLAEAVPFKAVYIHALVRDANREKMSKTKGNVIDPIEIIERFGTDAVRFTLASMASPGTDIAFSEARTEGYRAFANKIWNAARFMFMNIDRARAAGIEVQLPADTVILSEALRDQRNAKSKDPEAGSVSAAANPFLTSDPIPVPNDPIESRWILARLSQTAAQVNSALAAYRFDEAASFVYQFFWGDLCDWYLEIVKLRLNFDIAAEAFPTSEDSERALAAANTALTTLVTVFDAALRLLSPFMPFLTEEIWHALYSGVPPAKSIALTRYPQPADFPADTAAIREMELLQELIVTIRGLRKELGVPEKESAPIRLHAGPDLTSHLEFHQEILDRLARVSEVHISDKPLTGANARSTASFDVAVTYERKIDVAAERERLTKELAKQDKQIAANEARLTDTGFTAKAPAHIVDGLRKQTADLITLRDKTRGGLDALG
jgi:valyl-tRNA synthetase